MSEALDETGPGGDSGPRRRGSGLRGADRRIDPRRYRKLRRFLLRLLLHALWWDLFLRQPWLRRYRRPAIPRWQEQARRYRLLAIELGGVLIKLGQFLSIRVDILPPEITAALAGLQDEVPPAAVEEIEAAVAADLGRPVEDLFAGFGGQSVGSASLAQVHAARLDDGRQVVTKVLRPGIDVLVETDLAALALAARWLKLWRPIRRRVDLDKLIEEFSRTTRAELDLEAEGRNAERFAADFADDDRIVFPRIFWRYSGRRTLTMEDVSAVKIADEEGLARAGVDRAEVAARLYGVYMRQIFTTRFVHADPHPGNLFVRPLDEDEAGAGAAAESAEAAAGRPFQLIFVDFGMIAEVPEHLMAALREYVIGLASRDAHRVVQASVAAGVLLPGADLQRLEEVHEEIFDRFWGVRLGDMKEAAFKEARHFLREYWDVLSDLPFQAQVELLFVSRAVGMLSGLATSLDPAFDPWAELIPFARRLASKPLDGDEDGGWLDEVVRQGQLLYRLPAQTERVLTQAQRGKITVQASLAPDAKRTLRRLERLLERLSWLVAAGLLFAAGTLLASYLQEPIWAWLALGAAGAAFLWALLRR